MTGNIFNIMRYSIHDGPGIRTTVFMKGCPLSCLWCHNPESIDPLPQIMKNESKCIHCGNCDQECPTGALERVGYEISVNDLVKEILKDELYHESSGGGVTFSGGEPLYQIDFLAEALAKCRKLQIHTAVDTSGFAPEEDLHKIIGLVDLFLFDIKHIDDEKHKLYTGVSNELIFKNLRTLLRNNCKVNIRIPVIPGINDNAEDAKKLSEMLKGYGNITDINLLPYHNLQQDKYRRLGIEYTLPELKNMEKSELSELSAIYAKNHPVKIGG